MLALIAAALVLCLPALVLTAAVSDAATFRIPNWIPLTLLAVFPVAALAGGMPLPTMGLHAAVGVGMLVVGVFMFAMRWMGGGDAKLLAAAALWLGWSALPTFVLVTAIAGGGLSVGLLMLRSAQFRPLVDMGPRWFTRLAEPGGDIPYGLAICAGALAALPASPFAASLGL